MIHFNSAKDLQNAIGFVRYYGSTPALKLYPSIEDTKIELGILGSTDLRHLLKTLSTLHEDH